MSSSRTADASPLGVAVLGSTGSIGRQALDVLDGLRDRFRVVSLAAGRNTTLLAEQARRFTPDTVAATGPDGASGLDLPAATKRAAGEDILQRLATADDVDIVIVATSGVVSLRPVLAALAAGKVVATANKETLVAGGHLVMPLAAALAARARGADPTSPY